MSFLLLVLVAIAEGAAFVGARFWVIRSAGATSLRQGVFITREVWERATGLAKVLFVLTGPAACYLFAAALLFVAVLAGGEHVQEKGGRVDVAPGMPAAAAGLRDGDVIVSIEGVSIGSFEAIADAVKSAPQDRIDVVVDRDGETLRVSIPKEGGKIGVRPRTRNVPVSPLDAAGRALASPVMVNRAAFAAWSDLVFGRAEQGLGGPARMVQEVSAARERRWSDAIGMLGVLASYFLWVPVLLSLLSIPLRPRSSARSAQPPIDGA